MYMYNFMWLGAVRWNAVHTSACVTFNPWYVFLMPTGILLFCGPERISICIGAKSVRMWFAVDERKVSKMGKANHLVDEHNAMLPMGWFGQMHSFCVRIGVNCIMWRPAERVSQMQRAQRQHMQKKKEENNNNTKKLSNGSIWLFAWLVEFIHSSETMANGSCLVLFGERCYRWSPLLLLYIILFFSSSASLSPLCISCYFFFGRITQTHTHTHTLADRIPSNPDQTPGRGVSSCLFLCICAPHYRRQQSQGHHHQNQHNEPAHKTSSFALQHALAETRTGANAQSDQCWASSRRCTQANTHSNSYKMPISRLFLHFVLAFSILWMLAMHCIINIRSLATLCLRIPPFGLLSFFALHPFHHFLCLFVPVSAPPCPWLCCVCVCVFAGLLKWSNICLCCRRCCHWRCLLFSVLLLMFHYVCSSTP